MQSQVDSGLAAAIGVITAVIGFVFDLPAPAIFAAFIGSCFGVAMSDVMTYLKALKFIVGGTVASGLIASMFIHYFGDYPQRGVAAVVAFVLVKYSKEILKLFEKKAGFDV